MRILQNPWPNRWGKAHSFLRVFFLSALCIGFSNANPSSPGNSLPSTLIDDFNDSSLNGPDGSRTNLWGGRWAVLAGGSSMAVTYNGPGYGGGRYSAGVTGFMNGKEWVYDHSQGSENEPSGPWSYVILHCPLSSTEIPINVACHGLKGIQFWMKGDGGLYRVEVPTASIQDGDRWCWYGVNFAASAETWSFHQIPFSDMTRQKGAPPEGLPEHPDGTDVTGIQIYPLQSGPFAFSLAKLSFYGSYVPLCVSTPAAVSATHLLPPTPIPIRTRTPVPSPTPWPTYTPTDTPVPWPWIHQSASPDLTWATRIPEPSPLPRSTSTFIPANPKPSPTLVRFVPKPTATQSPTRVVLTPRRAIPSLTHSIMPTATTILNYPPTLRRKPQPQPSPTPARLNPAQLPSLDPSLNVVFTEPPANIYITFADGPGRYQVEVVDDRGNALETIFDRKIVAESDAWVVWDGMNPKVKLVAPGQYYVILTKDGKALKRISVIRDTPAPTSIQDAGPEMDHKNSVFIPANNPGIYYSGRFDFTDPKAPRFDWPAVSISTVFQGCAIGILLEDGNNNYDVFIDGNLQQVIVTGGAGQYTISGLHPGIHTLLLVKRTEASFGIATFRGLLLQKGMSLMKPPSPPIRRIEFVGDSLACGAEVEDPNTSCEPSHFRPTANGYLAYGPLAARALGADYRVTSYSGTGILKKFGDANLSLPGYYPRVLAGREIPVIDPKRWVPDAVVIELGGNDFFSDTPPPSRKEFEDAYKILLALLRSNYPKAYLFCMSFGTSPPVGNLIQDIVAQENVSGDTRVILMDVDYPANHLTGCYKHFDLEGQNLVSREVEKTLRERLGWSESNAR